MSFWAIHARSRKLGRAQRFLDQDEMQGRPTRNPVLAQQKAEAFAQRLNEQALSGATDWRAEIEWISSPLKPL